jgi:thymidylate synthase (FAD)
MNGYFYYYLTKGMIVMLKEKPPGMSHFVKLVSYSTPSHPMQDEGLSDLKSLVGYCARVSNPGNQNNPEVDGLIDYLIRNKHWSPMEMVSVCLEITTTRDIARQMLRHRSFSFQEFSQRYADPTKELEFQTREARLQDHKNRQNSLEVQDPWLDPEWRVKQQWVIDLAKETYEWAIAKGIAKEQARAVLPEGCTVSKLIMNGTLRSWIHYIELRTEKGTQKEHREIARSCGQCIMTVFPKLFPQETLDSI